MVLTFRFAVLVSRSVLTRINHFLLVFQSKSLSYKIKNKQSGVVLVFLSLRDTPLKILANIRTGMLLLQRGSARVRPRPCSGISILVISCCELDGICLRTLESTTEEVRTKCQQPNAKNQIPKAKYQIPRTQRDSAPREYRISDSQCRPSGAPTYFLLTQTFRSGLTHFAPPALNRRGITDDNFAD